MRCGPSTAVVLVLWGLLAGCGADPTGGDVSTRPGTAGGGAAEQRTELTVVVAARPQVAARTYTLTCAPAGGDHPDPTAACAALGTMEHPFAPVPAGTMCTEIYGGPQTATVTGRFRGEPVSARFSRTDGCQVARWDEHLALLVEPGGAEDSGSRG
jgi:hypothetical protein